MVGPISRLWPSITSLSAVSHGPDPPIRCAPRLAGRQSAGGASENKVSCSPPGASSRALSVSHGVRVASAMTVIGTEGSVDARTQLKSGRLDAAVQGALASKVVPPAR